MYADSIEQAEKELYTALEAIDRGDLTFARSSTARAQSAIVTAWRERNEEIASEQQDRAVLERSAKDVR